MRMHPGSERESRIRSIQTARPSNFLMMEERMSSTEGQHRHRVTMTVNGQERSAEVEPRTLLVHFLRDHLGLTGTHVGCDTSQCGACVVNVDGLTTKSCTMFAVQADGATVTTI